MKPAPAGRVALVRCQRNGVTGGRFDVGLLTARVTFDPGGDAVPGGGLLDRQTVGVSGSHPLFHTDVCALATDLIG